MKKAVKVLILAVVAVVYTVLMLVVAYPHNKMPGTYTEAKEGVVYIESEFLNGYAIGRGSGFAIGENGKPVEYIVTNYHVVYLEEYDLKADKVTVYFSEAANRKMDVQVYRYDQAKDIAVLKLPEPTDEVLPLRVRPYKSVDLSETFYALGYPARADAGVDNTTHDKTEIVTTSGMISRRTMVQERDVYMLDLAITKGNSGGPLVSKKGEVVGINTFGITDKNGDETNYAVCIDEFERLVGTRDIQYSTTEDKNTRGIIVIVATVVVDLVLMILMVAMMLKKPAAAAAGKAAPAKEAPKAEKKQSNLEATRAVKEESPVGKTIAVSGTIAVVTGKSGALKDQDFILKDKLVFGRDPNKCTVVLPIDAEGVSGLHCQIVSKGSKYMLTDLGSSYGTFVNSGLKVGKDTEVELSDGDTISLGSDKNMFTISIR